VGGTHRREPGKIRAVLRLIEDHPSACAYDFRSRFGLPVAAIFDGRITWDEAWMLLRELLGDPSSHLGAAHAGWAHPFSREAMILADLWDLNVAVNTDKKKRKPKPYPRPFKRPGNRSKAPVASQDHIRAALAARGHHM